MVRVLENEALAFVPLRKALDKTIRKSQRDIIGQSFSILVTLSISSAFDKHKIPRKTTFDLFHRVKLELEPVKKNRRLQNKNSLHHLHQQY